MTIYLSNAFSQRMLDKLKWTAVLYGPATAEEIAETNFVSVVGHRDTASLLSNILGKEVEFNRASIEFHEGDILYIAQLDGERLPEGCTELPKDTKLSFMKAEILAVRSERKEFDNKFGKEE